MSKRKKINDLLLPYAEIGPFDVGKQGLKINNERLLEITIWYPAENKTAGPQRIRYPYGIKMG